MTGCGRARGLEGVTALVTIAAIVLSCTSPTPPPQQDAQVLSPNLEPFLTSYFATWSAGDMRAYKDHFYKDAVITFVEDGEVKSSLRRDRFVMLQSAARSRDGTPAVERMTSFTADEDGRAATVVAQWELTKGVETKRGVDRFTLIRDERGRWRIVALVYYLTD